MNFGRFLTIFGPGGRDVRLVGLYDSPVEDRIRRSLVTAGIGQGDGKAGLERFGFYGCVTDLEDEMIRALGPLRVEEVIAVEGELISFRRLQTMPFHRQRSLDDQLHRFIGSRSGRQIPVRPLAGAVSRPHQSPRTPRRPARGPLTRRSSGAASPLEVRSASRASVTTSCFAIGGPELEVDEPPVWERDPMRPCRRSRPYGGRSGAIRLSWSAVAALPRVWAVIGDRNHFRQSFSAGTSWVPLASVLAICRHSNDRPGPRRGPTSRSDRRECPTARCPRRSGGCGRPDGPS